MKKATKINYQEVKQDTTLTVQWEDNHSDIIDVAAEEISSSNDI